MKTPVVSALCVCVVLAFSPPSCSMYGGGDEKASQAKGMVSLADTMLGRGDKATAMDFYRRALDHDPDNAAARRGMASLMESEGDLRGAADMYGKAVDSDPDDLASRRSYGKVLLALDMPAEAAEQYKKALEIDGKDVKSLNGMGTALDYLGNHDGARVHYERSLAIEPDNIATVNNMAYSNILNGDYETAISLLEPKLHHPRATAAMRQNLALAYGMAGMDFDAERVAKMDLKPEAARKNLEFYRAKRAEAMVDDQAYAEIGTYSTEALAEAQIARLMPRLAGFSSELKPVVTPEIASPGGTPRFKVRMMGCSKPEEVQQLCSDLGKQGIPCEVRNR